MSVHDYLDRVLGDIDNPTHQQIKTAKKAYWKQWYRNYRRERRKAKREVTLILDADTVSKVDIKRGARSRTAFLYHALKEALGEPSIATDYSQQLKELHHLLMELISNLDELLDGGGSELTESILERLEHLETAFNQLLTQMRGEL